MNPLRQWTWENDGDIDFLYFNYHSDDLILSRNNDGVFSESVVYGDEIYPNFFIQFDYNGDGFTDFLGGRVIFQNDGQGNFAIPRDSAFNYILLPTGRPIAAADFNNDGLGDIVMYNDVTFQEAITFYLNTGSSFEPVGAPLVGGYLNSYLEGSFHDLDGDGWKELILSRGYNSNYDADFFIFKNHGAASFEITHHGFGRYAGLSDMNGDGLTDVISADGLEDYWNPTPYGVWLWTNEGNGDFGGGELINPLTHGEDAPYVYMIDLTGDGLDDLLISGNSPSGLGVMVNEGFKFGPAIDQGPFGSSPGASGSSAKLDFDGDGDQDILAFHGARFGYLENVVNSPNKIIGQVFFDNNANGLQDPGENPAMGIKFGLDSLVSYAISDSSGRFGIPTGGQSGTFSVKVIDAPNVHFDITTPIPTLAQISTAQPTDTVQIGLRISGGPKAALEQVLSNHRCNETGRLWLAYTGFTNGPSSGELKLIFPNELGWQAMDSLPGVTLQGKEIHWPLSQLPTLTSQGLWVDFLMPNFQNIGDTLRFVAEITLNDGTNVIIQRDTLTTILTCAYDPNDKLIANIERFYVGDEHYTLTAPERVEYVVRFQNTGNDTANQVVILDNLSSFFDYSSFEFLSSSHPCRTTFDFTGLLRIEFPDIALPDSSSDFRGSMGYLKFAVSLKPNPPRNVPIRNAARILFDQNPPVLTNVAVFRIVDCTYFGEGIRLADLQCEGDLYEISIPTHGLVQTYEWTHNGEIISEADTASYHLTQQDNIIGLKINNGICHLDTSFYFHSNGGYPDLQLSLDSSTAFCVGSPIEITSNIITEWYRNDTLAEIGYSYLATNTQTLTAASSPLGQGCVTQKSIQLTAVPISNSLILEGDPSIFITRCQGDSVTLSTDLINGNWQWLLYDQAVGLIDSSRAAIFNFPIEQSPNAYITLTLDTLNCSVTDTRMVQMIPEGDIQLVGDTVLCAGINYANVYPVIDNFGFTSDSIYCYRSDTLVQVQYFNSGLVIQPLEPGEYTFVVFAACHRDTIQRQYYDIQDFVVSVEANGDSLFTSNDQPAFWYYAASLDSFFQQLPDFQPFLATLASGYYFFLSPNGNCLVLSDTVYYQSTRVSEQQQLAGFRIFPNPNSGTFTVELPEPAKPGTFFRITDLAGRLAQEQKIELGNAHQTIRAEALPNGLYFLQVVLDDKVLAVDKFVKQ
ncbi:MAG: VCBS repeat-containing protein [Lewinellaceae bacterium]|nr:VCBS repeat-containing protein [Lewinellaceae bacterium]